MPLAPPKSLKWELKGSEKTYLILRVAHALEEDKEVEVRTTVIEQTIDYKKFFQDDH
jgi:hypothetical protein